MSQKPKRAIGAQFVPAPAVDPRSRPIGARPPAAAEDEDDAAAAASRLVSERQSGNAASSRAEEAPKAPAPPPPAFEPDPHTVVFSKPYMAHGEPVSRVTLRKPVTKDIRQLGNPFKFVVGASGSVEIETNWNAVAGYVGVLAGWPPSAVDELEWVDLDQCAGALLPFFLPRGLMLMASTP